MKKFFSFLVASTLLFSMQSLAQPVIISPDAATYEQLKLQGKIPADAIIMNPAKQAISYDKSYWDNLQQRSPQGGSPNLSCNCMLPVDASYSVAPFSGGTPPDYRNDDGSTSEISIPFGFCFYGTTYNGVYINNNGNISFGSSYGTFSSTGFPNSGFVMVAPFWADVDTRGAQSGLVYYKITATHMIIRWENVGYFNNQTDKLNDFQLVITDGTDPILPPGMNINFCYGDMQWTTGSASGGQNGFGGTPATVGANKGDGVSFFQMGRFDQPGAAYDGPYLTSDGVSWLDNQSMFFNVCSSTNIAPVVSGISVCDTIKVCGNDTLIIQPLFLSPEIGQTTSVTVTPSNIPGITVLTSNPGNTATATIQVVAAQAPPGVTYLTISGTDDGTPAQTSSVTIAINIDTTGLSALNPVITGNTVICAGTPTTLSVPNIYANYLWSTGSTFDTTTVTQLGPVWITVTSPNGCTGSALVEIVPPPNTPIPDISGDSLICVGSSTLLTLVNASAFSSFLWPDNTSNPTYSSGIGTVVLTATDFNNCTVTETFTINQDTTSAPSANIDGLLTVCTGGQTTLGFSTADSLSSFQWSTGASTPQITVSAGSYNLSLTDTAGCSAVIPFTVALDPALDPDPLINGVLTVCTNGSTQLTLDNPALYQTYSWSTGANTVSVNVGAGTYNLFATDTNGCSGISSNVQVLEDSLLNPDPLIGGIFQVCDSANTTIAVLNSYPVIQWSNGASTQSINVGPGTYSVSVTDADGCTGISPAVSVVNFTPEVNITGNQLFCPGSSIQLTAVPNDSLSATFAWSNNAVGPISSVQTPGPVSVQMTYINGCIDYDTVVVFTHPLPVPSISASPASPQPSLTDITFTGTATISVGSVASYSWNFGDNTASSGANPAVHAYDGDGTYRITLTASSSEGCSDTVSIAYDIISEVVVPNVITPNGDGKNDKLVFKNVQFKENSSLLVYDRWGNKIYENANYKNEWEPDGSSGTYYFILNVKDEPEPYTGYFQLLK